MRRCPTTGNSLRLEKYIMNFTAIRRSRKFFRRKFFQDVQFMVSEWNLLILPYEGIKINGKSFGYAHHAYVFTMCMCAIPIFVVINSLRKSNPIKSPRNFEFFWAKIPLSFHEVSWPPHCSTGPIRYLNGVTYLLFTL